MVFKCSKVSLQSLMQQPQCRSIVCNQPKSDAKVNAIIATNGNDATADNMKKPLTIVNQEQKVPSASQPASYPVKDNTTAAATIGLVVNSHNSASTISKPLPQKKRPPAKLNKKRITMLPGRSKSSTRMARSIKPTDAQSFTYETAIASTTTSAAPTTTLTAPAAVSAVPSKPTTTVAAPTETSTTQSKMLPPTTVSTSAPVKKPKSTSKLTAKKVCPLKKCAASAATNTTTATATTAAPSTQHPKIAQQAKKGETDNKKVTQSRDSDQKVQKPGRVEKEVETKSSSGLISSADKSNESAPAATTAAPTKATSEPSVCTKLEKMDFQLLEKRSKKPATNNDPDIKCEATSSADVEPRLGLVAVAKQADKNESNCLPAALVPVASKLAKSTTTQSGGSGIIKSIQKVEKGAKKVPAVKNEDKIQQELKRPTKEEMPQRPKVKEDGKLEVSKKNPEMRVLVIRKDEELIQGEQELDKLQTSVSKKGNYQLESITEGKKVEDSGSGSKKLGGLQTSVCKKEDMQLQYCKDGGKVDEMIQSHRELDTPQLVASKKEDLAHIHDGKKFEGIKSHQELDRSQIIVLKEDNLKGSDDETRAKEAEQISEKSEVLQTVVGKKDLQLPGITDRKKVEESIRSHKELKGLQAVSSEMEGKQPQDIKHEKEVEESISQKCIDSETKVEEEVQIGKKSKVPQTVVGRKEDLQLQGVTDKNKVKESIQSGKELKGLQAVGSGMEELQLRSVKHKKDVEESIRSQKGIDEETKVKEAVQTNDRSKVFQTVIGQKEDLQLQGVNDGKIVEESIRSGNELIGLHAGGRGMERMQPQGINDKKEVEEPIRSQKEMHEGLPGTVNDKVEVMQQPQHTTHGTKKASDLMTLVGVAATTADSIEIQSPEITKSSNLADKTPMSKTTVAACLTTVELMPDQRTCTIDDGLKNRISCVVLDGAVAADEMQIRLEQPESTTKTANQNHSTAKTWTIFSPESQVRRLLQEQLVHESNSAASSSRRTIRRTSSILENGIRRIRRQLPFCASSFLPFRETMTSLARRGFSLRKIKALRIMEECGGIPSPARISVDRSRMVPLQNEYRDNRASTLKIKFVTNQCVVPSYIMEHYEKFHKPPFQPNGNVDEKRIADSLTIVLKLSLQM